MVSVPEWRYRVWLKSSVFPHLTGRQAVLSQRQKGQYTLKSQSEIGAVVAVRAEALKNKPSLSFHPGSQNASAAEMTVPCIL